MGVKRTPEARAPRAIHHTLRAVMSLFFVPPLARDFEAPLGALIDGKAKPPGALGRLEEVALRLGLVQNTLAPVISRPQMLLFAADHGLCSEGVSAYPAAVTALMVRNFAAGGAAINVFCRLHGWELRVFDVGVNADLEGAPGVEGRKVRPGTRNALHEAALTRDEVETALQVGANAAREAHERGSNLLGCGEMGIGNTATAALLMSRLLNLPISDCAGRGTGLDDAGLSHKIAVLERVLALHADGPSEPLALLQAFGGLEIAAMCGAWLEGASRNMILLVDGFIASVALALAVAIAPEVAQRAILCHLSAERGHALLCEHLVERGALSPLLDLKMRLGEGTGAALALPIVEASAAFLSEMADLPDGAAP